MSSAALAWRQFRLERRMFRRNPSAAFFNLTLPLVLLLLVGVALRDEPDDLDVLVPGVAAMGLFSSTFVAVAMNLTALREQGVLKRMRGTPMPPSSYLAALVGHAAVNAAIQVALISAVGALVFGVAWPQDVGALVVFGALGTACFVALGAAVSAAIRSYESAPAVVNAIFLPVVVISGVFYDAADAPSVLRDVAQALPLKHLIDGMQGAMVGGEGLGDHTGAVAMLVLWTAVGVVLAVRGFSWESRRRG